jgi:hypothetical protein
LAAVWLEFHFDSKIIAVIIFNSGDAQLLNSSDGIFGNTALYEQHMAVARLMWDLTTALYHCLGFSWSNCTRVNDHRGQDAGSLHLAVSSTATAEAGGGGYESRCGHPIPLMSPKIPYDYYKLPYNYYLFLTEFCNATKHYQPRRMNVGIWHIPDGVEFYWKSVRMCVEHRRGLAKHT